MGFFDFWKNKKKSEEALPSAPLTSPATSPAQPWDDGAQNELRDVIRHTVLGEVRLHRFDTAAILNHCREVYIEDQAPQAEWDQLLSFTAQQIEEAAADHAQDQTRWPEETDSDRLDRVEESLRQRGILLWQVSPCCDTCSGAELPDRIDAIEQRYPGFRQTVRGYAFYIDQNLPDMLAESTQVSLYLAYGWFAPEGADVAQDDYAQHALGIAHEIKDTLTAHGLDTRWNGEMSQKLGVSLDWRRRSLLM